MTSLILLIILIVTGLASKTYPQKARNKYIVTPDGKRRTLDGRYSHKLINSTYKPLHRLIPYTHEGKTELIKV